MVSSLEHSQVLPSTALHAEIVVMFSVLVIVHPTGVLN